jgi:hypothetical protein
LRWARHHSFLPLPEGTGDGESGQSSSDSVSIGGTVLGRYRLVGASVRADGRVWKAHDANLDQVVAIKMLLPGAGDATARERFRREALVLSASPIRRGHRLRLRCQDDTTSWSWSTYPAARSRRLDGPLPLPAYSTWARSADALSTPTGASSIAT